MAGVNPNKNSISLEIARWRSRRYRRKAAGITKHQISVKLNSI
jgi:hypothetical protein